MRNSTLKNSLKIRCNDLITFLLRCRIKNKRARSLRNKRMKRDRQVLEFDKRKRSSTEKLVKTMIIRVTLSLNCLIEKSSLSSYTIEIKLKMEYFKDS